MSGYSPHAHVQLLYGGRVREQAWKCPVKRCGETYYGTRPPACPFHRGTLMVPKRGRR